MAFARGVDAFYAAHACAPSPKRAWRETPDASEPAPPTSTWWRRLLGK
jgi:hypothetical protein